MKLILLILTLLIQTNLWCQSDSTSIKFEGVIVYKAVYEAKNLTTPEIFALDRGDSIRVYLKQGNILIQFYNYTNVLLKSYCIKKDNKRIYWWSLVRDTTVLYTAPVTGNAGTKIYKISEGEKDTVKGCPSKSAILSGTKSLDGGRSQTSIRYKLSFCQNYKLDPGDFKGYSFFRIEQLIHSYGSVPVKIEALFANKYVPDVTYTLSTIEYTSLDDKIFENKINSLKSFPKN